MINISPNNSVPDPLKNTIVRINIYPNPARDLLIIDAVLYTEFSIDIISIKGQIIFSSKMNGFSHQVDLSSFPKGVYLITIRSEDFVTTKKIIKL